MSQAFAFVLLLWGVPSDSRHARARALHDELKADCHLNADDLRMAGETSRSRATVILVAAAADYAAARNAPVVIEMLPTDADTADEIAEMGRRRGVPVCILDVDEAFVTNEGRVDAIVQRIRSRLQGRDEDGTTDNVKICVFLRHGRCHHDPARYTPTDEVALTREGRAEIAATAASLVGLRADRLISSPFRRAYESAEIVSERLGVSIETCPALVERHFCSLAGRSYRELRREYGEEFVDILQTDSDRLAPPGEETMEAAATRVSQAMAAIASGPGKRIIVVSHGGPHAWLLGRHLGHLLARSKGLKLDTGRFSVFLYSGKDLNKVLTVNSCFWDMGCVASST